MEKSERSQLELFNQPKDTARNNDQGNFSVLGYIRGYEKIILFIICFIITGIVFFSLGVEKGKKNLVPAINQKYDLAINPVRELPSSNGVKQEKKISTTLVPEITPQNTKVNETANAPKEEAVPKEEEINKYTIQIASFKNKTSARQEAQNLEKSGFNPLIQLKGRYNVVCIGNFENKEKAENLLTEIRKKYPDGFIRRL